MARRNICIPYNYPHNELHLYEGHIHRAQRSWSIKGFFLGLIKSKEEAILLARQAASGVLLDRIFGRLERSFEESVVRLPEDLRQFQFCFRTASAREVYADVTALQPTDVSDLIVERLLQFMKRHSEGSFEKSSPGSSPLLVVLTVFHVCNICQLSLGLKGWAELCCLVTSNTVPDSQNLEEIKKIYPNLQFSVIGLINLCARILLAELPLLVPLLHTLRESATGVGGARAGPAEEEQSWAGLERVEYSAFREKIRALPEKRRMMLGLMQQHKHLAEGRPLVQTGWLTLVATEDIPEFSAQSGVVLEHLLQSLLFRMREYQKTTDNNQRDKNLQAVLGVLHHALEKLQGDRERLADTACVDSLLQCCISIHRSACGMVRLVPGYKAAVTSYQLVLRVAEIQDSILEKAGEEKAQEKARLFQRLTDVQKELCLWRDKLLSNPLLTRRGRTKGFSYPKELELWDGLLRVECSLQSVSDQWSTTIEKDLRKRISEANAEDKVVLFCLEPVRAAERDAHSTIQHCLWDLCQSAIGTVCQAGKEGDLLAVLSLCPEPLPSLVLSHIIVESAARFREDPVGSLLDPQSALHRVLSQGDWRDLQVDREARQLLQRGHDTLGSLIDALCRGDVLLGRLQATLKHQEQFKKLYRQYKKDSGRKDVPADPERVLSQRAEELQAFHQQREHFHTLINMAGKIAEFVTVPEISALEVLHRAEVQSESLSRLVAVRSQGSEEEGDCGIAWGTVLWYSASLEALSMAREMHAVRESSLLLSMWVAAAKEAAAPYRGPAHDPALLSMSLANVQRRLWTPQVTRYRQLGQRIAAAYVTFAELDDALRGSGDRGEGAEIRQELELMDGALGGFPGLEPGWTELRFGQIQKYRRLHLAAKSAGVVLQVAERLELTGDFSQIHCLTQLGGDSFRQRLLGSLSDDLVQAGEQLSEVRKQEAACLEEFLRSQKLVSWIKGNLQSMSDLKVFVDLASISAGENASEIDRVACFHDAVMGYGPLLYSLPTDSGFEDFMSCARQVLEALSRDEKLPEKLRDSTRLLDWLKGLRETHGSVEQSSLALATAINAQGVYHVGGAEPGPGKRCLQSLLLVRVRKDGLDRDYSLEDLLELQNKLMLMSSKGDHGKEQVNRFSQIFEGVQRLGGILLQLHSAGNTLFRGWEAWVHCSPEKQPCVRVSFPLPGRLLHLRGQVAEQLQELCRSMERCRGDWAALVADTRSRFPVLNLYTAEQAAYLCHALPAIRRGSARLPHQVWHLLSPLNPSCSPRDIWEALAAATEAGEAEGERGVEEVTAETEGISGDEDSVDGLWARFRVDMPRFLQGHLDIVTLACFLTRFSETNAHLIRRDLPPGLHEGRPNLVLCPAAQTLTTALSFYAASPAQAPPSAEEVLLCREDTSEEEVDIFLRRALGPVGEGKLFTLLHPGLLAYEVGVALGERFEALGRAAAPRYRLLIVSPVSHQHKYVPSFFSSCKVQAGAGVSAEDVGGYLRCHLAAASQHASVYPGGLSVWVVSSARPAVGKSLYVDRLFERVQRSFPRARCVRLRLTEPRVERDSFFQALSQSMESRGEGDPILLHLDTAAVRHGLEEFLFELLVLGCFSDSEGKLWRRNSAHLIAVEVLRPRPAQTNQSRSEQVLLVLLDILPTIHCRPPREVKNLELKIRNGQARRTSDPLMDEQEFASEGVQRPYQYLRRYNRRENLDPFKYKEGSVEGDPVDCIHHLLANCGVEDPSWAELRNFSWFLNLQLRDCEHSLFCDPDFLAHHLPGFKGFIVKFMVLMARDFATPSLDASDQSPYFLPDDGGREDNLLARLTIRKRWESESHPYIFFNDDHVSMSFLGFHVKPSPQGGTLNAVDPKTGRVLMGDVMSSELLRGLQRQGISLSEDFDHLPREDKIQRISFVVGARKGWAKGAFDPDPTYELTADNVMKMLAIHMRFRCGIPVVVMGETGCGKTRLVRFLCDLQREGRQVQNMVLVKVHGGTTAETIRQKVRRAEELAEGNSRQFGLDTILFFDEANTTEAIFAIKEVICDRTVGGHPMRADVGLKVIAACNPYRRHSPEMIERLERAGLGYRVRSSDTEDRLGRVPLRQLVYRVQPLPPSMVPLVWDFGQLSDSAELSYIRQIVQTQVRGRDLPHRCHDVISGVLATSQTYMRSRKDECSFVSLRDVERSVRVLLWFCHHSDELFKRSVASELSGIFRCLALAVGVCYYPSLVNKKPYLRAICRHFPEPLNSPEALEREILSCQDVFLENIQTRDTVAKNIALKENVFLMVVCIELRIPLFLVGKPGSSKSLAKTVVADAMQGRSSRCALFRKLKQVHMVSFQCSPHSSPEGIIGTFRQCARFQQGKSLDEYVSVVVLDEVGLAEDSPQMPLKTLHPLLEDGRVDDDPGDNPGAHTKVGFVGISNWALDPAKMNRGIFVSRWDPSENELVETAKGICSSDSPVLLKIQHLFPKLAKAYLSICQTVDGNQFFGLRDYYSLVKMIFASVKRSQREPSESELAEAILRNFSGQPEVFDPLQHFRDLFRTLGDVARPSTLGMIRKNLDRGGEEESRYLLLLTTNNAALHILQQRLFSGEGGVAPEIVFGSGFPKDQEYSQVCRNVNRVKTCMETGCTVVLLNLQNLYESLYDALNQYYVYLGGQQYVDLGLGTHRVKCRVHRRFRLVVVEDERKVYEQFPVPLINRLEKHRVDRGTDLAPWQRRALRRLEEWVREFARLPGAVADDFKPPDAFVGFHGDACASALLQALEKREGHRDTETNEGTAHRQEASADWSLDDGAEGLVMTEGSPVSGDEQKNPQREEAEPDVSMDVTPDGEHAAGAGEPELAAGGGDAADTMEVEEKEDEAEMQESTKSTEGDEEEEVLEAAKSFLLNCATPDAILRLEYSDLGSRERGALRRMYFHQQHHLSLRDFMQRHLSEAEDPCRFIEVTTFSSLLTQLDVRPLAQALGVATCRLLLLSLHQFDTEASFCSKIRGFLRDTDGSAHILLIQTDVEESLCSDELIASAKYCTMNELRSVEPSPAQCLVVFITKLSRLKGGSQYVGFQGGAWLSVHIDDLRDTEDMSSDLSALCGTPISQLLALSVQAEDTSGPVVRVGVVQKGAGPRLHGLSLLRSCIQKAVSLLRDPAARASRSLERVQILLGLLAVEPGQPGVHFVQVLLGRLVVALAQREEQMPSPGEWVSKEAKKRQALQEGGTLRHTLWRCLQSTLTPVLAQVLGVLDRDANLDLLCCSGVSQGLRKLWLDILEDPQTLDLTQPQSVADQEINVQRHLVVGGEEQRCAAPFSWLIKMHCQSLWEESEFGPGTQEDDPQRVLRFVSSFGSSRLAGHIAKLAGPEGVEFTHRYLRDFVLLSFRVASEEEVEVFTSAVLGCVSELQRRMAVTSDLSPAWLTAVVRCNALRLDALSHVLQVQPRLSQHLRRLAGPEAPEMREDVLALGVCVEEMEQQPVTALAECESFLRRVELLQPCVERTFGQNYSALCSPGCLQHLEAIRTAWRGMLVVAAFIQQVVLSVEDGRLEALALKYCTPLQTVMRASPDLRSTETLQQVIRILNSYHEEFTSLDFRYGTRCPVCLADLVEPAALPCGHLFCLACLRHSVQDARHCPKCRDELPPHFQPSPSRQLSAALLVDQKLRACCNAFFLEVVSRFSLTEGVSPEEGVVELLFSLLISAQGSVYRTRDLSPLLDCVDDSPVVRSVLPKLLLQYSFEQVKGHIQSYLQSLQDHILDREDETELYRLFVNCFQDSLCVAGGDGSEEAPPTRLEDDARFLSRLARRQTPGRQDDPAGFLLSMARLRACLGTAAALLQSAVTSAGSTGESRELEERYLEQVKAVCEYCGNDWYRVYLLRAVNRRAGLDCVRALMNSDTWRWAFPPEVIHLQRLVPAEVDYFLCLGGPYRTLRDAVGEAVLESQADPLRAALRDLGISTISARVLLSLALFRQVTCRLASPNEALRPRPQETAILEEYLRSSTSGQHREFCLALLTNQIGGPGSPLHVTPAVPAQRRPLLEILVHAGALFQNGNGLLSPLHQLASQPGTMAASFLPTMPDDHTSEALRLVNAGGQSRVYYCLNGHPCVVGECGRPMQLGKCPDCRAAIGGQNHRPVSGFTQATGSIADQTRTGHVLGAARHRSDAPDRQVSLAEWTVLRLCTHLALLLGAVQHHQGVSAVIRPVVADVWEFLWQHLERDMEVLGRSLGQNVDSTAITIHLVLQGFLQRATVASSYQQGADLSSRQGRQRWEKLVCDSVIGPVIQSLELKLGTARQLVAADDQLSGGPLMRLLDGDPRPVLPLPSDCPTHSSSFWKLPEPLSVERFSQLLQQSRQGESVLLLLLFMKKVPCVRQLHHLPNLVALLRAFPLAMETESQSIGQVLQQIPAGQRKVLETRVKIFMEVWNQVRMELATSAVEMGVAQDLCEVELRIDSSGRFLSLCHRGPGSCLSTLIRFLSETHNSLVREARRQSRQGDSDYSVPLEVVSEAQLALCHPERELLPLVLAHCHYTLRKGEGTSSSYDLQGIQVQLTRRFLAGKPLIQEDTSKYLSRQSQDFSSVLAEVRARIPQVPLKGSVRAAMRATLRSFTDACDAAFSLEVGLRFLGKTGGDPRNPLVPYLRDTLRMEEHISSSVAKVLGESRLEHSVSTWQLLTCWKSELRVSRGQEPFQKLPEEYRQRLSAEEKKAVTVFLGGTDAEAFSWELHEILFLKTSNSSSDDNYPPHWDISSTLEIHLEQKDSPPLPGLEGLPEELTLEKGADIWRLAVEFKQ
ncbi:E3 ubiquitin-protein ligase rnf213-beta-like [Megalops cyprinoides]|uniref:E3 ubiquitin-protein ligase rnf213-beta-like n=1 Tax=Megalops cyprinoides TaxID=118141 RepID=UPI001864A438|nr:E3 ubiquitin-protein ligase rnf213-beta-like [Megalops cyprinoides]